MRYTNDKLTDQIIISEKIQDDISKLQKKLNNYKEDDFLIKSKLIEEYYQITENQVIELYNLHHTKRDKLLKSLGVNGYVFRTLFDYNRYSQCVSIYNYLVNKINFSKINVLDFGCLVSDYGFFFGKLGARISICDHLEYINFASFRLSKFNIQHQLFNSKQPNEKITLNQDFIIFGEVLEHLTNPYALLKTCLSNKTSIIFTSCYPYGDDSYFSLSGHKKEAQEQSADCQVLLKDNYHEIHLRKNERLWIKKDQIKKNKIHLLSDTSFNKRKKNNELENCLPDKFKKKVNCDSNIDKNVLQIGISDIKYESTITHLLNKFYPGDKLIININFSTYDSFFSVNRNRKLAYNEVISIQYEHVFYLKRKILYFIKTLKLLIRLGYKHAISIIIINDSNNTASPLYIFFLSQLNNLIKVTNVMYFNKLEHST